MDRRRVNPRAKVWLESTVDGHSRYAFGWGISEILKAVDRAGSIKGAAGLVGKSYRHVWDKIKASEAAFGRSLVETRVGGGRARRSQLTPAGQRLVLEFDSLRENVLATVQQVFDARIRYVIQEIQKSTDKTSN